MKEGEVTLALAAAAVGHAQQPRPFVVIERQRLAARDPGGADVLIAASAPTASARPRSAEKCLATVAAPDAFERVAVDRTAAGVRSSAVACGPRKASNAARSSSPNRRQLALPFVIELLH